LQSCHTAATELAQSPKLRAAELAAVRTPSAEQLVCHCAHCLSQGTSVLLVLCCSTCLTHPAEDKTMYGFVCCCLLLVAAVVLMLAPVYRPGVLSRVQQGRGWASVGAAAGVRYAQSSLPNSLHPLNHSLTHSLTHFLTHQASRGITNHCCSFCTVFVSGLLAAA
jgi:hypothetical protein